MTFSRILRSAVAAVALMATASSLALAQSGRLSLADRVERLERQQQEGGAQQQSSSSVDLLNRITQLQTEAQVLRGMIEEQEFKLRELERRNRDLAVDFDARLERLEGGAGAGHAPRLIDPEPALSSSDNLGGVVGAVVGGQAGTGFQDDTDLTTPPSQQDEAASQAADPAAERAAYDAAFEALKNGQYAEAARRFQAFLSQYPNGEYAPNAQYWLGESYYVTQNYQIALDTFERLLAQFPNSNKVPDALLKVGYSHYELRNWTQAEDTLNRVIQMYPDSTVARLAQGRLRALRLEHRQ